jgi:hypothetical protein
MTIIFTAAVKNTLILTKTMREPNVPCNLEA